MSARQNNAIGGCVNCGAGPEEPCMCDVTIRARPALSRQQADYLLLNSHVERLRHALHVIGGTTADSKYASRELSIAATKLDELQLWAQKHIVETTYVEERGA